MTRIQWTALAMIGVVAAMLGLAFSSKALYDTFCRITGYGGTTRVADAAPLGPVDRDITIRFDANVVGLPLEFGAQQVSLTTQPGINALAFYTVTNTSDQPVIAHATYNVTPHKMGPYFSKLECFCFTDRVFNPGETVSLPVVFFVDPAMDAVGWRVSPDGSVSFVFNQAPPLVREPGLGGALVPGVQTPTRMRLSLAADGTPAVALSDRNDKPRLRLTVTEEGFGAIQFLNAEGQVVHTIAPEADLPTN
jgi:cytochrome c oxidase assembly protein Cox11